MKSLALLISLFLSTSFDSFGQELNKSALLGTWTRSTGEPGRTIQGSDGAEISLLPVTSSITKLKLKRFGRAVETTRGFNGMFIDSKFKGKWKMNGDTLRVQLGNLTQIYLIDQSIEERLFLNLMHSNNVIYGREY
jgi:hypothetical protein